MLARAAVKYFCGECDQGASKLKQHCPIVQSYFAGLDIVQRFKKKKKGFSF